MHASEGFDGDLVVADVGGAGWGFGAADYHCRQIITNIILLGATKFAINGVS
jgi:hypothetical protein